MKEWWKDLQYYDHILRVFFLCCHQTLSILSDCQQHSLTILSAYSQCSLPLLPPTLFKSSSYYYCRLQVHAKCSQLLPESRIFQGRWYKRGQFSRRFGPYLYSEGTYLVQKESRATNCRSKQPFPDWVTRPCAAGDDKSFLVYRITRSRRGRCG